MVIKDNIFKKARINFDKLKAYGFNKIEDKWKISKIFMDNAFRADIVVDKDGIISGKVFDIQNREEYLPFRVENGQGGFASIVKEEYGKILEEILDKCFDKKYFISNQANRICNLLFEKYNVLPDFPWENQKTASDAGVFRKKSGKWFVLIMNIKKNKLVPNADGDIDVMNLKLDEIEIQTLINSAASGFYPAYHMNKKNWISLVLDETLLDEVIMKFVSKSYKNVK